MADERYVVQINGRMSYQIEKILYTLSVELWRPEAFRMQASYSMQRMKVHRLNISRRRPAEDADANFYLSAAERGFMLACMFTWRDDYYKVRVKGTHTWILFKQAMLEKRKLNELETGLKSAVVDHAIGLFGYARLVKAKAVGH